MVPDQDESLALVVSIGDFHRLVVRTAADINTVAALRGLDRSINCFESVLAGTSVPMVISVGADIQILCQGGTRNSAQRDNGETHTNDVNEHLALSKYPFATATFAALW